MTMYSEYFELHFASINTQQLICIVISLAYSVGSYERT